MAIKLFVYGTLKKGFRNHPVLGPDAKFISEGSIYGMVLHKGPGFPYATYSDDNEIFGEVYELEDLANCDRLEGYPHHYIRQVKLVRMANGSMVDAWVYIAGSTVNLSWYPETTSEWTKEN